MSEEILNQSWVKIQALIVSKTKVDSMSFKTAEAIRDSVCMVIEEFTIDQAKLEEAKYIFDTFAESSASYDDKMSKLCDRIKELNRAGGKNE